MIRRPPRAEIVPHTPLLRSAMRRRLFPESKHPNGHPDIAQSLINLSRALLATGQAEKALPHGEQALAMPRRHFPDWTFSNGHPCLAASLSMMSRIQALTMPT